MKNQTHLACLRSCGSWILFSFLWRNKHHQYSVLCMCACCLVSDNLSRYLRENPCCSSRCTMSTISHDLMDEMEVLLSRFGCTHCRFALEMACSKQRQYERLLSGQQEWPALSLFRHEVNEEFDRHSSSSSSSALVIQKLANLVYANIGGYVRLGAFAINMLTSQESEECILLTLDHYNKIRTTKKHKMKRDFRITHGKGDDDPRWAMLELGANKLKNGFDRILKHRSMELFQGFALNANNFRVEETLNALIPLFQKGKHEHLVIATREYTPGAVLSLQRIIELNCLRTFTLRMHGDGNIGRSAEYLRQAFVNLSTSEERSKLKALVLETSGEIPLDFLASIGRLGSLKTFQFRSHYSTGIVRILAEEIIANPSFNADMLVLKWCDYYDYESDEERLEAFQDLGQALASKSTIRLVSITMKFMASPDISKLFQVVMLSPSIENFVFTLSEGCYWEDFVPELQFVGDFVGTAENGPQPLRKLRRLRIKGKGFVAANPSGDAIKVVLRLASKLLPYLCKVHIKGILNSTHLHMFLGQMSEGEEQSDDELGDIASLYVCLERNQVGRALLLPEVAPTVPLSLWSIVLEKAANSESFCRPEFITKVPPVNGIYYVIQELVQGGGLVTPRTAGGIAVATGSNAAIWTSGHPTAAGEERGAQTTKRQRLE